jgi:hypothetical protein
MFGVARLSAAKVGATVAMIVGAGLRLFLYWQRPSLWNDEVYVALNVITRHFGELLQRLEFEQSAPVGFLWLEHVSATLFGASEYSLRAMPLVCGLASLPLSWYAAGKFVIENGALLVTAAVAFSSCAF